ncbi:MAG: hypothetical protein RBR01_05570 [Desulfobacterales bacterium]|nr:hypothetical protein [Desulfobacterales bacterium]
MIKNTVTNNSGYYEVAIFISCRPQYDFTRIAFFNHYSGVNTGAGQRIGQPLFSLINQHPVWSMNGHKGNAPDAADFIRGLSDMKRNKL